MLLFIFFSVSIPSLVEKKIYYRCFLLLLFVRLFRRHAMGGYLERANVKQNTAAVGALCSRHFLSLLLLFSFFSTSFFFFPFHLPRLCSLLSFSLHSSESKSKASVAFPPHFHPLPSRRRRASSGSAGEVGTWIGGATKDKEKGEAFQF